MRGFLCSLRIGEKCNSELCDQCLQGGSKEAIVWWPGAFKYNDFMSALLSLTAMMVLGGKQGPVDAGAKWVGTVAKSEIVNDENGKPVDLSKIYGKHPVVLVFYRAIW